MGVGAVGGQMAFYMRETGTSGSRTNRKEKEIETTRNSASRNMRTNIRRCASDGSQLLDKGAGNPRSYDPSLLW